VQEILEMLVSQEMLEPLLLEHLHITQLGMQWDTTLLDMQQDITQPLITQKPHTTAAVAITLSMVCTTQAGTMLTLTRTIHQQLLTIIHIQEVLFTIHILVRNITTQHILEARLEQQTLEIQELLAMLVRRVRLVRLESRVDLWS
jgi:hypothetical protein